MITEKIKTFEDACAALGINPSILPDVSMLDVKDQKYIVSNYKLIKIAEALNEGWQPDWNDKRQWKYFPWFEIQASEENPSGFGFSFTYYDLWRTYTTVGSRLFFKNSALAVYAGKQFSELYQDIILIQK